MRRKLWPFLIQIKYEHLGHILTFRNHIFISVTQITIIFMTALFRLSQSVVMYLFPLWQPSALPGSLEPTLILYSAISSIYYNTAQ